MTRKLYLAMAYATPDAHRSAKTLPRFGILRMPAPVRTISVSATNGKAHDTLKNIIFACFFLTLSRELTQKWARIIIPRDMSTT